MDFAQDLSPLEIEVLRDALRPTPAAVLSGTVSTPAWRSKPRAIPPALEMAETAEMNDECHFNYLQSSHLAMISHPVEVARMITLAAQRSQH